MGLLGSRMERNTMAKNNSVKHRESTVTSGTQDVKERNRKSQKNDQPKTRLEPGSKEWSRYWSIVFRRMR